MSTNIDITKYLPHRAPFLMVDTITHLNDEVVETVFEITADNIFVDASGFFTEAGLVENAAQTCSAIVAKDYFVDENLNDRPDAQVIGFISAIKTLKVLSLPKSGEVIITKSRLVSNFVTDDYSLCTMHCQTFVDSTQLLEGEINLFIQQQTPTVVKSNV
ncbi:ABC transporter permease [Flavobacterium sp. MAH-1]|uniref:ABC transporter permease n=1 Tax=Flavobacterium agri TaxID=2743471 RepID=A0A7Y9C7I6_9FLAO|nr:ABC transporter permease [Flavobacterium agri]NUY81378.1 ABC transporter permease [Flavobacterium agri]NYA71402.1 ABC transporter permease [Flavobacterium agri]